MNAQLVVTVQPYGVLGMQLSRNGKMHNKAGKPDTNTAFLDPAGLHFIQTSPSGADGASGAIYRWLDIAGATPFPSDVTNDLDSQLKAKFHAYGTHGEKKCIHVVACSATHNRRN